MQSCKHQRTYEQGTKVTTKCRLLLCKSMPSYVTNSSASVSCLAGRPEHCTLNSTLSFAGNSTRRWLYSSLLSPQKLVFCKKCFNLRINRYLLDDISYLTSDKECGKC